VPVATSTYIVGAGVALGVGVDANRGFGKAGDGVASTVAVALGVIEGVGALVCLVQPTSSAAKRISGARRR